MPLIFNNITPVGTSTQPNHTVHPRDVQHELTQIRRVINSGMKRIPTQCLTTQCLLKS
jgi:hypothetical protein